MKQLFFILILISAQCRSMELDYVPLIAQVITFPSAAILEQRFQDKNLSHFISSPLFANVADQTCRAVDIVIMVEKLLERYPIQEFKRKKSLVSCILQDFPQEVKDLQKSGCLA